MGRTRYIPEVGKGGGRPHQSGSWQPAACQESVSAPFAAARWLGHERRCPRIRSAKIRVTFRVRQTISLISVSEGIGVKEQLKRSILDRMP